MSSSDFTTPNQVNNSINKAMENVAYIADTSEESSLILADAESLGGIPASNYATQAYVSNAIANAQLSGDGQNIDLSGYATKDDITLVNTAISNIDFPVDSVNGKSGAVSLTAEDVGARPSDWMPTATDVGARSSDWMPNANDVGAAPAGYGLGEVSPTKIIQTQAALDSCITGGQYRFYGYANGSFWHFGAGTSGMIEVKGSRTDTLGIRQYFYPDGLDGHLVRRLVDGSWQPWEWVNPPMIPGVEYRTTERWNGSPVYAKGINIGYLAAGSHAIAHNCAISQPISCQIFNNNKELLEVYSGLSNITVDRTNINLICGNAFGNITVYLKYTK